MATWTINTMFKEKAEEAIVKNILSNDILRWCVILIAYSRKKNIYYVVGACSYFAWQLNEIDVQTK